MRVLCVDDNKIIRFVLSRYFSRLGIDVIFSENGDDAFKAFLKYSGEINFVILDLDMPGYDGYFFIKKIVEYNLVDCPKIFIHSTYSVENIICQLSLRNLSSNLIYGFLDKPVQFEELQNILEKT